MVQKLQGLYSIVSAIFFVAFLFWSGVPLRIQAARASCWRHYPCLIFGIGVYIFRKGTSEQSQFAEVQKEKKLLNMVLTQGQVNIGELVGELEMPRDAVEDMIRSVVGKQLFSGAIDWKKGVLYSVESQQLTEGRKCPNCGSDLTFAGKGLISCQYCGSEVFLTKRAAASTA